MKGVISYRTDHLDELKKISKIRNISLSTLTGEIIEKYLYEHNTVNKYDMFIDSKKFVSAAFEELDPSSFDKIADKGAKEISRFAKMSMNEFTLENILYYFIGWMKINKLKLSQFDENERVRWICETNMGKNYNEICGKCIKKVLENFGYASNVEDICKEDFEIIISKEKHNGV